MNLLEKEIIDSDFIGELLPQKKPFVMVHKLSHFSEKKITSKLAILADNIFVKGNQFTEPGLIENMAQTIALHTGYKYFLEQKPAPIGYIGAIKKAEVFTLPLVSQEITTSVEILHDIMGVTLVQASVSCDGKVIAQSEMKTALAQ